MSTATHNQANGNSPTEQTWHWDSYSDYRPGYPPSTLAFLTDYHAAHSSRTALAHDVASGNGVFARSLASHFSHVHVSDPGQDNIATAHRALSSWATGTGSQTTFSFSKDTGENAHLQTGLASVDMLTVMEAAHWIDGHALSAAAAKALAPGGTFAVVTYIAEPFLRGCPRAQAALFDFVGGKLQPLFEEHASWKRAAQRGSIGLDFIPAPREHFEDVRRIEINATGKQISHWADSVSGGKVASQVGPDDKIVKYDGDVPAAMEWTKTVKRDWFKGFFETTYVAKDIAGDPKFLAFEKLLAEEVQGDEVVVEFQVNMLLATRRRDG